jgi:FdrA protein
MKIFNVVRKNTYYDSVTLMLISKQLKQLEGLDDVSVMMGTAANRVILKEANLLDAEGEGASPNDLILAFRAPAGTDVQAICKKIDEQMAKKSVSGEKTGHVVVRSSVKAYQESPDSNLAFISVPGEYAAMEAERALKFGKNVLLFSDNVSLEDEVNLKTMAGELGLLVMGPDCGTSIINGKGIGFANKVARGNIGLVAASGTGLQEVTCLIDALGLGITQAIGTGGRDLKEDVGARTMLQALDLLLKDEATEIIILLSKPPAKAVVDKILARLAGETKKIILCFIGYTTGEIPPGVVIASTLEEAAFQAAAINGKKPGILHPETELAQWSRQAKVKLSPKQKIIRGLYAGGTLCYEAMFILGKKLGPIYSNTPLGKEYKIHDAMIQGKHSAIDLGDDEFTMGRPHPMIDGTIRNEYIAAVAKDPETAVLLIDVVIGYGASEDPAGDLVPVLVAAQQAAAAIGNHLPVVAYVCGTNRDEQNKEAQQARLREIGVMVVNTNAEAARLTAMIVEGLGERSNG